MKDLIAGIDLGGTKISSGIMTKDGKILSIRTIPTFADRGVEVVTDRIALCFFEACKIAKVDLSNIRCVGIGAPGPVDPKTGFVNNPPNLVGWEKVNLKKIMGKKLSKKIMLENDANCAALAELFFGAGKKYRNFVYVTISTGIGAGIIIDKKLYSGANGSAGEVGHMIIDFNSRYKCGCGKIGHLEGLASGTAISKIYNISPIELSKNARKKDKNSLKIINEVGHLIGLGFTNLVNLLNPEAIIVGGGVSNIGSPLFSAIKKSVKENALADVKIIKAKLKNNVGVIGAASLCISQ